MNRDSDVMVKFGTGVPSMVQAKLMFDMQLALKKMGYDVRVLSETKGDDSKLRVLMTPEERTRL